MADIDYAQQNKIRVALGLKPLPQPNGVPSSNGATSSTPLATGPRFKNHRASSNSISDSSENDDSNSDGEPASTLETRAAAATANWKQLQDEAEAKKAKAAKAEAIKKARDRAQRFVRLEGKGLGETTLESLGTNSKHGEGQEEDTSTRAWLLGQKKRQRRIEQERAKKMEEELAERERGRVAYGAEDLAGVKVGHEMGDFDGLDTGGEQILTLKDNNIDENEEEGDELENMEIRERDKLQERLDLKKKKPVYDPLADEAGPQNAYADGLETGKKNILSKYDEEIEGKKRKHFVFDGHGTLDEGQGERAAKRLGLGAGVLADTATGSGLANGEAKSDYMDLSEIKVKVKKPKKSKKKVARQKTADEDEDIFPPQDRTARFDEPSQMDIDQGPPPSKSDMRETDRGFVDDEDLQASLAAQRRAAFKQRKQQRPEDIARQIRGEDSATSAPADMNIDTNGADEPPGLVIDETSEFVANLQGPTERNESPASRVRRSARNGNHHHAQHQEKEDPGSDDEMREASPHHTEENELEEEEEADRAQRSRSTVTPEITTTGLNEEATLDGGVGAAFTLLKQRGLVKTAEQGDLNALHRDRQRFLAEKQKREAEAEQRARLQRERDRASGKLERMSAREREEHARWENKQRDQLESRQMADIFNREYKPDVQLRHVDEHGRIMNEKEAFKYLSHQFHGKGSGQQKTEKHLKKIQDEKKREAMSTLDASRATGMNNAMGTTAKKNKQAGVRLG